MQIASPTWAPPTFGRTAYRRFGDNPERDAIIDFVAELRARDDVLVDRLPPEPTERVINMIFNDKVKTAKTRRRRRYAEQLAATL